MRFSIRSQALRAALCAAALTTLLTGCGGSSSPAAPAGNSNPPDDPPAQAQIQGIETPSGVSVVTATNAN